MNIPNLLIDQSPRPAIITDDVASILGFALESAASGLGCALATLVEIRGGAARALGAQMAIRGDGSYCGFVSGGCVEAAVAAEAVSAIEQGRGRLIRYGLGSPYFDIALPCGGGIAIAISLLDDPTPVAAVLDRLARRQAAGLLLCLDAGVDALTEPPGVSGWRDGRFLRHYAPDTRIILFGGTVETQAMARLARDAGFVVDLSSSTSQTDIVAVTEADPLSAVVLLHHDVDREIAVLQAALESRAFYVGALGSARSHERRKILLAQAGLGNEAIARIRAPIGIFPKARDARTLALSVLADIAASRQELDR